MIETEPLPAYNFRPAMPSLADMLRHGVSDPAAVIPAAILEQPCVQLPGPGAPLVVADPELAREVLNDRHGHYARDRFMRRLMRRAWGKGLAAAEGEAWHAQRRAAAPAFRPQAVEARSADFAAAAGVVATDWPIGEHVDLPVAMAKVIARIVFTTLVDGRGKVDSDQVAADIPAYIRRIAGFGLRDMLPLPESWHDRLAGIPGDPAVRRIRALARRLAAEHENSKAGAGQDLLALLDGVGPLQDNVQGLFPAAMDTTVAGASWTLFLLARHPEWQARVCEEGQACTAGQWSAERLPVTRRVVQEALRLYPPAPLLVRTAAMAHELGGKQVRKGQPVVVCIYAMHRHRQLWHAPDMFDPDRFLPDAPPSPGWLPFGAGPRVCIAAQFALAEIAVVAARLLAELELAPCGPAPDVSLRVTTRSANGIGVIAARRR